MKLKIFIVVLAVIVAWVAGRGIKGGANSLVGSVQESVAQEETQSAPGETQTGSSRSSNGSSERRINEFFKLAEGAKVEVTGINGAVSIEAIDGETAELKITSTAGSMRDLDANKLFIEHTDSSLVIRGKGNNGGGFWRWLRGGGGGGQARHTVVLKLPRYVELAMHGINGKVVVGELEGAVQVAGINGRVEIGKASGGVEVNGVNGGVTLTVMEVGNEGLNVNGINGGVEFRFGSNVNADLNFNGVNGSIKVEAPNVEVQEEKRSKLRARVGTGGANIEAHGINGGVRVVGV